MVTYKVWTSRFGRPVIHTHPWKKAAGALLAHRLILPYCLTTVLYKLLLELNIARSALSLPSGGTESARTSAS